MAEAVAADLLRIGAVSLSPSAPYTWASGLRSPIYCDNRLTLAYPDVRSRIADGLSELIRARSTAANVVIGTATAGIPHAAWVAERMALPMAYVRSKPKEHGRGNQIEGRSTPGDRAVIVEDLISTGGSSLGAVDAVRAAGVEVLGVVGIFSYGFPEAEARFAEARVPFFTLTGLEPLLKAAAATGRFSEEELEQLRAWRQDPRAWSDRMQTAPAP